MEERDKHFPGGKMEMHYLVSEPEKCRKFLSAKFDGLKISTENELQDTTEVDTEGVVPPTSSTSQ